MAHFKGVFRTGGAHLSTLMLLLLVLSTNESSAACGGVFTSPQGVITSPGYPSLYPNRQDCVYIIQRPEGEKITLTFHDFDMEGRKDCPFDSLEIRDGDSASSPPRITVCGDDLPSDLKSFSSALWIQFESDESNVAGGFKASYTSAAEKDKFLLVTAPKSIHIMHYGEGGSMRLPLGGVYKPVAVDYDPVQGRVYWADAGIKEIRSAFLNGTDVKTVLNLRDNAVPTSIALDPVSRLFYYVDLAEGFIGMVSMVSFDHRTVISSITNPYSVVLDNSEGVIFWLELRSSLRILRSRYDGTDRKAVVSRHLLAPRALALDRANKRLYWLDAKEQRVEWSDYDGRGRSSQVDIFQNTYFFALTVSDAHLYIIDRSDLVTKFQYSVIRKMEKDGSNSSLAGALEGVLTDIHLHDDMKRWQVSNGCSNRNGGCSHFCVPLPGNRHQCMCPDRHVLAADQRTCRTAKGTPSQNSKADSGKISQGIRNLKTGASVASSTDPRTFTKDEDDDDFWDDVDWEDDEDEDDDVEEDMEEKKGIKSTRGSSYGSQVVRTPPEKISGDDYLNRQHTAAVFLTGPRPFDTDGSRLMLLSCYCDPKTIKVHLWRGLKDDCIKNDENDVGVSCLYKPKIPEDDGSKVTCEVYYDDGRYGGSEFTIQLNYPPPSPPVITGYRSGQVLKAGQSLEMRCTVKGGKPLVSAVDFYCPGHPDTEPDEEGLTEVHTTVTIRRLMSSDNEVTCVCSAEWKVPEMYTAKASVTLRVTADVSRERGGEL